MLVSRGGTFVLTFQVLARGKDERKRRKEREETFT